MAFRTKLDFSSNRQVKQHEKTITKLSGGTSFGLTFSAMTSGPDLSTTGISETYTSIASTFSGNSGTTNYTWYDSRMSLADNIFSALTPSNSATTQNSDIIFTANSSTIIDGNFVALSYSGVSFDLSVIAMYELGSGNYSGTVLTTTLDILSANTLDFTGRTIWNDVSGITRTERLIITDSPVSGYVWTCIDSEGLGEWQYNGSSSGATTFWEETGTGNTALKDVKGLHTISGISDNSILAGGNNNIIATSLNSGILGGDTNQIDSSNRSFIGGGASNNILNSSLGAIVMGGGLNVINNSNGASIIGGIGNDILSSSQNSTIIGGGSSLIDVNSEFSGIFVGSNNTLDNSADRSAIIGGGDNTIDGADRSVIIGGQNITGTTDDTVYTPNLIINTGGTASRLGINTDSPQYILDVHASTGNFFFSDSVGGLVYISGTTGLPRFQVSAGVGGVGTGAGGTVGMRAWDDVTYATYGQPGDMHIYAGVSSNGLNIISADGSGGAEDYIRFYAGRGAGNGDVADIHIQGTGVTTTGYVGLGTNNPTAKLHVSGSTRVSGNGRFETIGSSASAGALHYTADGTLTTNTSDERLKTNIVTLTNALDKVKSLRGVKYNWLESPTGDTRIGFIAQEVGSIVPELSFINKNSPEQYMGVHYDNMTALLVEAVKELASGVTTSNNTHLETQTILAEDNNIDLNYSGTPQTAVGGGLTVLHAKGQDSSSELITDENGDWITNNDFKAKSLTIPLYTPTSSSDAAGTEGNITRDDNHLYIKTSNGWKRTNLENF